GVQAGSFSEFRGLGIEGWTGVPGVSHFVGRMPVEESQVGKPIETITNFVDLAAYPPGRPPGTPSSLAAPGQKVLLHVSNFRPVKRISDVVRIFERVAREVDAVLLMVGEGPERASAQALARRRGLQDRVRFLGTYESIVEILLQADVFLLPSELEP